MNHGSLFSGIGGFDLAAEWMGWENLFHCEWNEFGQRILKHYWPNAESFTDIKKTCFKKYAGKINILTGGFPCQPYSTAGKRKGKEDERHLWPEMLRAIREISPCFVVGENVRGLTNWNGGLVFDEVQSDLENEGYEVLPFLLPACAVNAPHRRDRIWFIAFKNTNSNGRFCEEWKEKSNIGKFGNTCTRNNERVSTNNEKIKTITDSVCLGQQRSRGAKKPMCKEVFGNGKASWFINDDRWPTKPAVYNGDDGLSKRLDGITFREWSEETIKGGGNAIVPQLALQIFKAIEKYRML